MDGYLKIKTKLDNKGIDKDISELEDKIKKMQTDNMNSSKDERMLQEEISNYEKLQQEAEKYRRKLEEINNDKKRYEASLAMLNSGDKSPNKQIINKNGATEVVDTSTGLNAYKTKQVISEIENEIAQMKTKYSQTTNEIDKQAPKIEKVRGKLEKVKAKQTENNNKIELFKQKIEQINLKKVENSIDSVGKNIQNSIGKIGKMAMAVMGLRTAWGAVRSAVGMVSQYNSQVSTDFEYMRYCIANAIAPAVQYLIQLLYTVLSYVNAIASAWFGINLFSNSSAKNFKKMQNSAGGTAKSAKEIQKSLQGFDEMNILQDDGSTSGNAGVGIPMPSMDLSEIQGEVPAWLKWIIDNGEIVRKILEAIATAILAIKWGFSLLQGLGLFMIIDGVVSLIKDLKTYLENPTWGNFAKIMKDIAEIIGGLGFVLGVSNPFGLLLVVIGQIISIIGGVIAEFEALMNFIENPSWENFFAVVRNGISGMGIVGDIILWIVDALFGQQEATTAVEQSQKNLEEATRNLEDANNSYVNSVDRAESAQKKLDDAQKKTGLSGEELFKQVQQGTLDYQNMTEEQRTVYKAYLDNEQAQRNLKEATNNLTEAKKKEKIASFENKLATLQEKEQYDEYKNAVVQAFKNGELSAEEARDLIGKSMSGMSRDAQKTFMQDLPSDIKDGLDPKNYETAGQKMKRWFSGTWDSIKNIFGNVGEKIGDAVSKTFKKAVNTVLSTIERVLNTPIRAINTLLGVINMVPGINLKKLNTLSLPRLAKGGVISQPTQAIIGEAGREAVVPLENNLEWLDMLADKIASKIDTGSGSFIINMDGRTIQRGIARKQNELAFAKNGR